MHIIRFKWFFLSLLGPLLMFKASAQQVLTIHGVISKKESSERVAQALIKNLRSGEIMMSDELGWFTVKAAVGDTLLFTKQEFTSQKVVVQNGNDFPVYMQPVVQLQTVTIKGQSTKQELNDVMQGYKQDGVFNDGKSLPFWQFFNSPVTGLYNLFAADPAKARRFARYAHDEQEFAAITRRYTPAFVKNVTAAPDTEIVAFMEYYMPTYDDIKRWNDYDLAKAVKKRFDYYEANKARIKAGEEDMPLLEPNGRPKMKIDTGGTSQKPGL